MSEGFAAAGAIPALSDFLSGLPGAGGILPEVLAGVDGELDPSARLIFETLAQPGISMRFLCIAEGSFTALEVRLASRDGGQWVAFARPEPECWDLAIIGEREQALALVDEVLGVTFLPDPAMELAMDLPKRELVHLLARIQKARKAGLQARLDGCEDAGEGAAAPAALGELEAIVAREYARPDPGSLLSRFAIAAGGPELLSACDEVTLAAGLEGLVAQGHAYPGGSLTVEGAALADLLASRSAITVIQTAHRAGEAVVVDQIMLLHGPGSVLLGAWSDTDGNSEPSLSLRSARPGDVLALIDCLLGEPPRKEGAFEPEVEAAPPSEAGICGSCGTLYEASSRFCRECGIALSDAK
ncbi:hypothetical protein SZ64_01720 [Erythrobacter sp. SG61-1L]|uniref:hypothetical protein n=1 Tax=Erythrobacter sp. SG61-1L TaxID=1603897 RepID=UPI0006C90531|nr:hypothetical protein [Erythrobacter sp. SG61-1L]KPL66925.1 hypothetical protein SZ64_01720 [Erythrobacter sp. SG61-1L]